MRVFVSAGEASGDLHGANLIRELRALDPALEIEGYGGPRMRAAGQDQWTDLTAFAVMGITEVFRRARSLLHLLADTRKRLEADPPDLVVLIDYPGLHFQIARRARSLGIRVLYYIIPQFWAWGAWRIGKLRRRTDHRLVILPFESSYYAKRGVDVEYVGHPILDPLSTHQTDAEVERRLAVPGATCRLGILPGSRLQEVEQLLPAMLRIAAAVRERVPDLVVATALPSTDAARRAAFEREIDRSPVPVVALPDDPCGLMKTTDLCLVASGTATLELACIGTPMVVLYRVSRLARFLAPLLLRTPSIGLVNVVAGRPVVPEYLFSREPIAEAARDAVEILTSPERRQRTREDLALVRESLGGRGASERAARAVMRLLGATQEEKSVSPRPA